MDSKVKLVLHDYRDLFLCYPDCENFGDVFLISFLVLFAVFIFPFVFLGAVVCDFLNFPFFRRFDDEEEGT